jgi:GH35 family endo-1,4-beta-xylanase
MSHVRGARGGRDAIPAEIYRDVIMACLEPGVCRSFSVWGLGDKDSWLEAHPSLPNADLTTYNDKLQARPAYDAVYDALRRHAIALANLPCPAAG